MEGWEVRQEDGGQESPDHTDPQVLVGQAGSLTSIVTVTKYLTKT